MKVVEEAADVGDRLPPALPARERLVEVRSSIVAVRFGRIAVPLAVVALAQAPVEQDRRGSGGEGDVGGLDSPAKVGAEHGRDPVVPSLFTELVGLPAPSVGEAAVAPARGNAESLSSLIACVSKTTVIATGPTLRAVSDPAAAAQPGRAAPTGLP